MKAYAVLYSILDFARSGRLGWKGGIFNVPSHCPLSRFIFPSLFRSPLPFNSLRSLLHCNHNMLYWSAVIFIMGPEHFEVKITLHGLKHATRLYIIGTPSPQGPGRREKNPPHIMAVTAAQSTQMYDIWPQYYFAQSTILISLLSYTKMLKIAAIRKRLSN